ncbi:MAG: hypothetical protein LBG28_01765, partial [Tannerella sp.]|nr:hypothetical protein [Tannerella sp.]
MYKQKFVDEGMKDYHPGRGVYRSAYKNALRLARTEINAAYRRAEWESYQKDPLIKGYRIMLSNNHTTLKNGKPVPFTDICDELQGEYPKSFLWEGWHPQCRCRMVPVVISKEELFERMKARKEGRLEEWRPKGAVQDVQEKFKEWVKDNAERIAAAEKRGTLPYFLKDNRSAVQAIVDKNGLKYSAPAKLVKPVKYSLDEVVKALVDANVGYNEVRSFPKQLTETEIISRVCGGDLTKGSCSSLAFAYAGNKCGF